jgi:hypothetical protein
MTHIEHKPSLPFLKNSSECRRKKELTQQIAALIANLQNLNDAMLSSDVSEQLHWNVSRFFEGATKSVAVFQHVVNHKVHLDEHLDDDTIETPHGLSYYGEDLFRTVLDMIQESSSDDIRIFNSQGCHITDEITISDLELINASIAHKGYCVEQNFEDFFLSKF